MLPVIEKETTALNELLGYTPEFMAHINDVGQVSKDAVYYNFTQDTKLADSQPHYYIITFMLYILGDVKTVSGEDAIMALIKQGYSQPLPVDTDDVGNTFITIQKQLIGVF